jgi:hypothetical protein
MKPFYYSRMILLFIFIKIFCNALFSQEEGSTISSSDNATRTSFGFSIGLNRALFSTNYASDYQELSFNHSVFIFDNVDSLKIHNIDSKGGLGLTLGVTTNYRLNKNISFSFSPTLSFCERAYVYDLEFGYTWNNEYRRHFYRESIEATNIELPIHIQYNFLNFLDFDILILAGPKYSIDLISKENRKKDSHRFLRLKQNDILFDLGIMIRKSKRNLKYSTKLLYSHGFNNLIVNEDDVYSTIFKNINSRVISLIISIE